MQINGKSLFPFSERWGSGFSSPHKLKELTNYTIDEHATQSLYFYTPNPNSTIYPVRTKYPNRMKLSALFSPNCNQYELLRTVFTLNSFNRMYIPRMSLMGATKDIVLKGVILGIEKTKDYSKLTTLLENVKHLWPEEFINHEKIEETCVFSKENKQTKSGSIYYSAYGNRVYLEKGKSKEEDPLYWLINYDKNTNQDYLVAPTKYSEIYKYLGINDKIIGVGQVMLPRLDQVFTTKVEEYLNYDRSKQDSNEFIILHNSLVFEFLSHKTYSDLDPGKTFRLFGKGEYITKVYSELVEALTDVIPSTSVPFNFDLYHLASTYSYYKSLAIAQANPASIANYLFRLSKETIKYKHKVQSNLEKHSFELSFCALNILNCMLDLGMCPTIKTI